MIYQYMQCKTKRSGIFLFFLWLFLLTSVVSQAQITGPGLVCKGVDYNYSAGNIYSRSYSWTIQGGTIVSGRTGRYPTVRWNEGGGTLYLEYWSDDMMDYVSAGSKQVYTYTAGTISGPNNV